jgi:two-component system chemotaxis response regulator CheY
MSPMSGFDLLREIRAAGPNQRTPFLMVTAESKTENVIAARRAGVSGYIVKPFNAAILSSRIDQVLADEAA